MNTQKNPFSLIDKPTFFGAIFVLLAAVIPLLMYPEKGAEWIAVAKSFMTDEMGIFYLLLGLASLFFMVYIIFLISGRSNWANRMKNQNLKPYLGRQCYFVVA